MGKKNIGGKIKILFINFPKTKLYSYLCIVRKKIIIEHRLLFNFKRGFGIAGRRAAVSQTMNGHRLWMSSIGMD